MSGGDSRRVAERLRDTLRDVPDFPRQGVVFKDLTPAWSDAALLRDLVGALAAPLRDAGIDRIAAMATSA